MNPYKHLFIIRYSEIGLKGKNREWFEQKLMRNIRQHLSSEEASKVTKIHGRIIVETNADSDKVTSRLQYIPGIANFSLALETTHELGPINEIVLQLVSEYIGKVKREDITFKIAACRSDKHFSKNSVQLAAELGGTVLERYPTFKVDLTQPECVIGIEIWPKDRAILYLEKTPGVDGLPVGTSGKVLSFLSGGIDSPLASYSMMTRGSKTVYINFHSYPFIGEQSREKVIDLVKHLSRFQTESILLIVPFTEIQKAIKQECQERYRTLLYRRLMYHIGNRISKNHKISAYVTGEAVGQVASQTIENLTCTEEAANKLILRPLIGMAKSEIINKAKQIGTYPISIQPFPDCCTVFQPRKPETHARLHLVLKEENKLDVETLVNEAVEKTEKLTFETQIIDTALINF